MPVSLSRPAARVALLAALALGCGGDDGSGPNPALPPASAVVNVGSPTFFESARNSTRNPAVDTVAVNGTVTWTWVNGGAHSVQSQGSPAFETSATRVNPGDTVQVTFPAAGTYAYECGIHGAAMTGTVVVR